MRMRHFWAQNGPFAPNNFFLWKIVNIILIYLLARFIVQYFKKILPADPELTKNNPKILVLDHFWLYLVIFAQWGFFPKYLAVTHN